MKYFTHQKPPRYQGELFYEPSLTRGSDNMDIQQLFAMYFPHLRNVQPIAGALDLSPEEREAIFDGVSESDLMDADLVEQKNFVEQMANINVAEEKQEEEAEQSVVEETVSEPVSETTKGAE